MSFQFGEKPDSRGGTTGADGTETREYFAHGSTDRTYVEAFAMSYAPASITTPGGILHRQPMTLKATGPYWDITVPYAKQKKEAGSYTISFDTSGGTVNMKASLQAIACYDANGVVASPVDGTSIDVDEEGVPQGTEAIIPALKLDIAFRHPQGVITEDRIRLLARNTGKVSSDPFLGFEAGETLFAGATGSQSESEAEVKYSVLCSENVANLVIGGITVAAKQGWDYASVRFKKTTINNRPATIPEFVTVHRLYRRTSLAALLGFGG